MAAKHSAQQVRIISGKWKGRKLRFKGDADLRPTLGRTRETLFNWLRAELPDSRCLDLFAGSGILGLEALSQGAAHCVFVERHREAAQQLQANLELLDATHSGELFRGDARRYLSRRPEPFDLVFLDPPFRQPELLLTSARSLIDQQLLRGYLYAESDRPETLEQLAASAQLETLRKTKSGSAHGALFKTID